MADYKCIVASNSTHDREYTIEHTDILQAAQDLGRAEGGETVTIYNATGDYLRRAIWDVETKTYVEVYIVDTNDI